MTSPAARSTRESLLQLLTPVVHGAGLDLEDVALTPAGRRRALRVTVDGDGGVGLDAVAQVSSAVSAALDASDVMGGTSYVLEVTSPGTDRPLTEPRHWRRAGSRLVEATLTDGSTLTGRVTGADEHGVRLATESGERALSFGEVAGGRVQVELNRPVAAPVGSGADSDEEA